MIDLKLLRKQPEIFYESLKKRNQTTEIIDQIIALDKEWRSYLNQVNNLKSKRNELSKNVARLKAEGKSEQAEELITQSKVIGDEIANLEAKQNELEAQMLSLALYVPNTPHESVPTGKDETENVEIRRWGEPRKFDFEPKPHWDLGTDLGMLDFDKGSKLSGSRFTVMFGQIAKLERSIAQFMLDVHTANGYTEVNVPHLVKRETITATGQLPKFSEELYTCERDDLFLIPTAEVSLAALHIGDVLDEDMLPLKYTAFTPCYRREAGSYGKDVRGLIRQHQFEKVELVWYTKPDNSFEALEQLTHDAEKILQLLGLPYRVITLCTGDIGFAAAKTYDIEVWLPSYNGYKEISSCSNDTDFQARRGNIRYRAKDGKMNYVHTLNGSGLAIGRTLVAIMENYQNPDGSITVPEVLRPYMKTEVIK
ncbi:MAG TPA: serine--tRNA ligase [Fervidobacterium sp.]|nr:serine--tRNA ligase [Thermotogaceae bacterium]HOK33467.1 serine--tRNA ligase [Fervidobacterium sp.]HOL03318.1 serine--tRNA ligase [Fervidobacterium sp.]HON03476.1 serine--tRNA ligase [Fervidobacterium sp.]HOS51527.1 serine--tRNA ligase [Fervidobacterium sp.]